MRRQPKIDIQKRIQRWFQCGWKVFSLCYIDYFTPFTKVDLTWSYFVSVIIRRFWSGSHLNTSRSIRNFDPDKFKYLIFRSGQNLYQDIYRNDPKSQSETTFRWSGKIIWSSVISGLGYSFEVHSLYKSEPIGDTSCQLAAFTVTFLGLVSISHLAGIAVGEYTLDSPQDSLLDDRMIKMHL